MPEADAAAAARRLDAATRQPSLSLPLRYYAIITMSFRLLICLVSSITLIANIVV